MWDPFGEPVPGRFEVVSGLSSHHLRLLPDAALAEGAYVLDANWTVLPGDDVRCHDAITAETTVARAATPSGWDDGVAYVLADEPGWSSDAAMLLRLLGLGERYRVLALTRTADVVTLETRAREQGYPLWADDGAEQVSLTVSEGSWSAVVGELRFDDAMATIVVHDARVSGELVAADGVMRGVRLQGLLDLSGVDASLRDAGCDLMSAWGRDCQVCPDGVTTACADLDAAPLTGTAAR